MGQIIRLTEDEFDDFLWGDNKDYEAVAGKKIVDRRRWSVTMSRVYKKLSDGTFWELVWDEPATEQQDGQEYNAYMHEVEPKEVTIIQYVAKKD